LLISSWTTTSRASKPISTSQKNEYFILFNEPECFDTEAETLAFCGGINGCDERATPERFPLRSCETNNISFIEAIESH